MLETDFADLIRSVCGNDEWTSRSFGLQYFASWSKPRIMQVSRLLSLMSIKHGSSQATMRLVFDRSYLVASCSFDALHLSSNGPAAGLEMSLECKSCIIFADLGMICLCMKLFANIEACSKCRDDLRHFVLCDRKPLNSVHTETLTISAAGIMHIQLDEIFLHTL